MELNWRRCQYFDTAQATAGQPHLKAFDPGIPGRDIYMIGL
jgi:hypothetical protein